MGPRLERLEVLAEARRGCERACVTDRAIRALRLQWPAVEIPALSAEARACAFVAIAERELDVLVIGGDVVGAGAAHDAAARGLSVAVVEAQDFASGTSSRSTKLIHGGLRYLE